MDKKDFRVWCDTDYVEQLKSVANEKGTSLNQLVLDTLEKAYKPVKKVVKKKDVRLYMSVDEIAMLKAIAKEKGTSVNQLVMNVVHKHILKNATLQNCEVADEQPALDEIPLDAGTGETASTIPCESGETHSSDVEITVTPEEDTDNQEITIPDDEDSTYNYFNDLLSRGSEPHLFTKKEKKAMRKRITAINNMIRDAQDTGNHLPKPVYAKLVEQKKALIPIAYPDNDNN